MKYFRKKYGIIVLIVKRKGEFYIRITQTIYNDMEDYKKLGLAILDSMNTSIEENANNYG